MPSTPAALSCEQCRQRKTKCDKLDPCSACRLAGIGCTVVQRARLPRGRAIKAHKRNERLEGRLLQLEKLVQQLEAQVPPPRDEDSKSPKSNESTQPSPSVKLDAFVARDFWVELSEEVAGLRDTLEDSDDEAENLVRETNDAPPRGLPGTILFGHSPSSEYDVLEPPSALMRARFLDLYSQRVDPVFKVTHWPTSISLIESQYRVGHPGQSQSVRALEFSIYFLAICSLNDHESGTMLLTDRQTLLQRYRLSTETLLSKTNLLRNPDLIGLQAFVIYLLGLRVCKEAALSWTLVATATRVATALRLPDLQSEGRSKIDLEVGRRVWFCIGVLDSQTSFDRGFPPITTLQDFSSPPAVVNDSQLTPAGTVGAPSETFNDMSFMYVLQEATICMRKLCVPPPSSAASEADPWQDWRTKVHTIAAFEASMKEHKSRVQRSPEPLARFVEFSTEHISLNMHLLLRRPPYRHKHSPVPPWDDFNLLEATTTAMERVVRKSDDSTLALYAWFSQSWVEWNALAILLAELCTPRHDDDLARRAYRVAQQVYSHYAELLSGPDSEMLWKPIAKLMRRVHQIRGGDKVFSTADRTQPQDTAMSPSHFNQESLPPVPPTTAQPSSFDAQMADLAPHQPASTAGGTVSREIPLAPSPIPAGVQPGDMSWFNWDVFLGEMQTEAGEQQMFS